jgi:hypothetical protein
MSLIIRILASCPDHNRPSPPDRSMKPAKGGLLACLDTHDTLASKYLEDMSGSIDLEESRYLRLLMYRLMPFDCFPFGFIFLHHTSIDDS